MTQGATPCKHCHKSYFGSGEYCGARLKVRIADYACKCRHTAVSVKGSRLGLSGCDELAVKLTS